MADQGQAAELLWSSEASLELLGPVRLGNTAGDDLTPKARKTRALLAVLALSKSAVPRSRLIDLLWGDRGEEQAKASLRQALYELRGLASRGYIAAERESVGLGPKRLHTDLGEIQRLTEARDAGALADALEAVETPMLGTLDDITPEFDEWLRDERARIGSTLVSGGTSVAEETLTNGHAELARRLAEHLERLDPVDERVARLGIRADLASGDRPAAMRRYGRLKTRLHDELGISPSPEIEALLEETKAPRAESLKPAERDVAPSQEPQSRKRRPRWIAAVAALLVILAAAAVYVLGRSSPVEATPTIAVLPFEEADQKQNYFASGVSDEILNLLAHQTRLRVLGRISAEQIGERANSLEAAQKLGVTHLLDGSVRSAGNRVLVIVRLTRVSDGAQLWSERYERQAGDIFKVQGDIASAVAARLARSLAPALPHATSPQVYDLYLSARQLARERREVTLAEADGLLRQAIGLDPNYAPAYAELAEVIMLRSDHPTSYGTIPVEQARAMAEPFARKAVALDPSLGDGYAAIGFLSLSLDGSAEPYMRKAVELSPQRPDFHRWHAETLMALNRFDDAIAEYKRAVEIDPLWGLNYDHLIGALYSIGRKDEARAYVRRFIALSTDERAKGLVLFSMQKFDEDLAGELKTALALERAYPNERQMRLNLASVWAQLGERQRAAALMTFDPRAEAAITGDWAGLQRSVAGLGNGFWDQSNFWNAASLLVASGHSDLIVTLLDRDRPTFDQNRFVFDNLAIPEMIIALRKAGRNPEADRLLAEFHAREAKLPSIGLFAEEKALAATKAAALDGDRESTVRRLDELSRRSPFELAEIPAMALRYEPAYAWLSNDPRFAAIEDRIRVAINSERAKVGLPPISREAWISDPKALLTKN
jgi:DNA-binding SARP family transcriptional activator/TolB-like protein